MDSEWCSEAYEKSRGPFHLASVSSGGANGLAATTAFVVTMSEVGRGKVRDEFGGRIVFRRRLQLRVEANATPPNFDGGIVRQDPD